MRSYTVWFVLILMSFTALAKKDHSTLYIKSTDVTLKKVGGFYMSQEITNGQYLAFIWDLTEQGRTDEATQYLPDSTQWGSVLKYNEPLIEYYFRHHAYRDFPLVGVTKEAAEAYCAWLTDKVRKDDKLNLPDAICALPSEDEWITASAPFMENPYPWYGPYAYNEEGYMLCNITIKPISYNAFMSRKEETNVSITAMVESFYPNKFGLYNVIGNVAEITSEGYIKGGSWGNTFDECDVTKRQNFTLPSAYVGFRVMLKTHNATASITEGCLK